MRELVPNATRLDQVGDGFGRAVGDLRLMPRCYLVAPLGAGASEAADLGWAGLALEIEAELSDELGRQLRILGRVDRPDDFLGVPGVADFAVRVAGLEQSRQFQIRFVVETFVRDGHQLAGPVERIALPTSSAEGFVLQASANFVEHEIRELHDVERISDLDRARQHHSNVWLFDAPAPEQPAQISAIPSGESGVYAVARSSDDRFVYCVQRGRHVDAE